MKESVSKRDFDKEAATWDTPPRIKLAEDISAAILRNIPFSSDMDVLDFGCGTGLVTLSLSPLVHSVTGVDSSKGMLEVLEIKAKSKGLGNVRTLHLDLTRDDSISGGYHAIVSSMSLHHIKNTQKLLNHFYQALFPGGYIAIADLDEEGGRFHDNNDGVFHFGFDRENLSRLFWEAGFTDVHSITAAQMNKPGSDGRDRLFTLFLMIGRK